MLFVDYVQLSLVEVLVDHIQLLVVRHIEGIQVLVNIFLANWYVVLKIRQVILIIEVVHLHVHSFHHMVANLVTLAWLALHHRLLHVVVEVPGDDRVYFILVILGNYL